MIVSNAIYRARGTADGQILVEEWTGRDWSPSTLAPCQLREARVATNARLAQEGIPLAQWEDEQGGNWTAPELTRLFAIDDEQQAPG